MQKIMWCKGCCAKSQNGFRYQGQQAMSKLQLFGFYEYSQCKAQSKRSGSQCKAPAMRGKSVCRMHGGKSTGPKSKEGRAKCAEARTIHGKDTRKVRLEIQDAKALLRLLEDIGFRYGFLNGTKWPGRRS